MKRFKNYPVKKREDKIVYGDGIVDGIVLLAIAEVPMVELCSDVSYMKNASKAIKVSFSNDGVNVEVKVKIHYSQSVTDMAFKIQETIRHNIESMTDYHVESVNVIVKDVLFKELAEENVISDNHERVDNEKDCAENNGDKTE